MIASDPLCNSIIIELNELKTHDYTITFHQKGEYYICLIAYDTKGKAFPAKNNGFKILVPDHSASSSISDIGDFTVDEDEAFGPINFTLTTENGLCSDITMTSSDPTVLPANQIAVTGTAPNCQISGTPAANQFGFSNVTLSFGSGANAAVETFKVTVQAVNDEPIISSIDDQIIDENGIEFYHQ